MEFLKACKNFSFVNGHLMYMKKRPVVFEKDRQQLIMHDAYEELREHP